MYKTVNRRRFIQTSLATAAAVSVPAARSNAQNRGNDAEAIVIGSGFRKRKGVRVDFAAYSGALDPCFVDALRAATNGGWALGAASFERRLADALRRRVTPLPRGRPRSERAAKQQQLSLI